MDNPKDHSLVLDFQGVELLTPPWKLTHRHWKIDGWKINVPVVKAYIQVRTVVLGRVYTLGNLL